MRCMKTIAITAIIIVAVVSVVDVVAWPIYRVNVSFHPIVIFAVLSPSLSGHYLSKMQWTVRWPASSSLISANGSSGAIATMTKRNATIFILLRGHVLYCMSGEHTVHTHTCHASIDPIKYAERCVVYCRPSSCWLCRFLILLRRVTRFVPTPSVVVRRASPTNTKFHVKQWFCHPTWSASGSIIRRVFSNNIHNVVDWNLFSQNFHDSKYLISSYCSNFECYTNDRFAYKWSPSEWQ